MSCTAGLDVGMHPCRVQFCAADYPILASRGLWDTEGALPQGRIPEAVEQAIVFDCLHRPRLNGDLYGEMIEDPRINWNVRNLACRSVQPSGSTWAWEWRRARV